MKRKSTDEFSRLAIYATVNSASEVVAAGFGQTRRRSALCALCRRRGRGRLERGEGSGHYEHGDGDRRHLCVCKEQDEGRSRQAGSRFESA